ncbi:uncharacterized protein LOC130591088 [Beta vulgaris subsp. vulgaris]|uniref:uncharacterized protein LOC130591088 n=1 Tax=Beta vulgaris subsp. vulgaris TaxID=3555 RepID=UPI0025465F3B|nr:uncharacterized protein LOC130591088 [Beta vulgaris subsp. vulgaris]
MAATTNNTVQVQLPKLNGKNYDNWSTQLKVFFRSQDMWSIVENGFTNVTEAAAYAALSQDAKNTLLETRRKDQKALYHIFQAVEEPVFIKISMAETSHEAWKILRSSFKGDERVKQIRLQTLRGEFESLCMDDSESISTYFDRVQLIVNQMRINGENIEDEKVVQKVIRSLNSDFDGIVSAIEEAHNLSTLSIERLLNSLTSHEQRMRQRGKSSNSEQALQTRANVSNRGGYHGGCGRGRGRGRGSNFSSYNRDKNVESRSPGDSKKTPFVRRDKSKIQCHMCEHFGHYASECRTKLKENYNERANVVEAKRA